MQSFHQSRARILFEVACAFGMSASCVVAWMQTYSTAMLPAAAIAALYGLVRASDMLRSGPQAAESVDAAETHAVAAAPAPVADPAPELSEPLVAEVAEPSAKRPRKPAKPKAARGKSEAAPEATQFAAEPLPEIVALADDPEPEIAALADEPEVVDLSPELRVVESASDEAHYVPATPLFEAEPFVRQQRAAFGRKAR